MSYYFARELDLPFDDAIGHITAALAAEGFGVLTEIDVRAKLGEKLGVDFRPYRILGACNPALAHQALGIEDKIGLLLPCNVVVQQLESGCVEVSIADPLEILATAERQAELRPIALDARERLQRALEAV